MWTATCVDKVHQSVAPSPHSDLLDHRLPRARRIRELLQGRNGTCIFGSLTALRQIAQTVVRLNRHANRGSRRSSCRQCRLCFSRTVNCVVEVSNDQALLCCKRVGVVGSAKRCRTVPQVKPHQADWGLRVFKTVNESNTISARGSSIG